MLLEKVRETISRLKLLEPKSRVIIGFSAGVDSVCLLHLLSSLSEYELEIWALYVNHGLRPEENQREIALLNEVGRSWSVHTRQIDIALPEKLRRKPQSLQLLARKERYRAFLSFREEIQAERIALAHHRDDQAETVLYRMIRGTGPEGLAGIPAMRDNLFIRPLLEVTRAEILEYVKAHSLQWIEDSSNHKLVYRRNRIRHQLLPEIEANYNPRVKEALSRLAELAGEQRDLIEKLYKERAPELVITGTMGLGVKLSSFLQLHPYLQYYTLKTVTKQGAGEQLQSLPLQRLREKIQREREHFTSIHIYKDLEVAIEQGVIWFRKPQSPPEIIEESIRLTVPGVVLLPEGRRITVEPSVSPVNWSSVGKNEAYVDAAKTKVSWQVRYWRPGDIFHPLGLDGNQKLHDFFINLKIPRRQRRHIPLLINGDQRIIWIAGYRVGEEFKVDENTRTVWHIQIEEDKHDKG